MKTLSIIVISVQALSILIQGVMIGVAFVVSLKNDSKKIFSKVIIINTFAVLASLTSLIFTLNRVIK